MDNKLTSHICSTQNRMGEKNRIEFENTDLYCNNYTITHRRLQPLRDNWRNLGSEILGILWRHNTLSQ
jgi:hypothetical protein